MRLEVPGRCLNHLINLGITRQEEILEQKQSEAHIPVGTRPEELGEVRGTSPGVPNENAKQ